MHLPKEFAQKMQKLLGEDYDNYSDSFAKGYGQTFRVNQLKLQPAELLRRFAVRPVPWCETGFYYEGEERLSLHPLYYGGAYYIQEPCAMAPASFLPVKPGDKVLDLCAAPGGKTTALAAKMQGEGVLIANDISISRCKALLKNMELAGVTNAILTCETPERLAERFAGYFDCVLVDAPCSGEGMFRRDASMAAAWSPEEVARYSALQKEIVRQAAKMVCPGGYLLYSTCTYSPEENEQVVETLLSQTEAADAGFGGDGDRFTGRFHLEELPLAPGVDRGHPEWSRSGEKSLTYCRRFWNHRVDGEGQFAALLKKEDGEAFPVCELSVCERTVSKPVGKTGKKKKRRGDRTRAAAGTVTDAPEELFHFLAGCGKDFPAGNPEAVRERFRILEERVFLLPEHCPDVRGLRVVRSGLYLGDSRKKRFTPSQALAMALRPTSYANCVCLSSDDARVEKYLRGETIEADSADGWVLICVEKLPLGWGKASRGNIKNKIAPGWRRQ